MSETRSHITASASFSGSSGASAVARPLKRRLTSAVDLNFFTPAATSFKPKPYAPHASTSLHKPPIAPRIHPTSSLAPMVAMDPIPSDPHALFIHPPFIDFPGAEHCPEGLTYAIMAGNLEWFLDATDFVSTISSKPNAIPYPSQLEPPRGWCPAKKKDLKERGPEGWPEGEEPRLRCTFCRRTYAGVNAKSMWRRHVFEKHKIAMSNRRDGNDRTRGRSSNKENKQMSLPREIEDEHTAVLDLDVAEEENTLPPSRSRSRYRSIGPSEAVKKDTCEKTPIDVRPALGLPQKESLPFLLSADGPRPHPLSQSTIPTSPVTPPLSPDVVNPSFDTDLAPMITSPPTPLRPMVPPSPYDPAATPSFRHSTPRLPSDQPWRFPSPSHPLHSQAREVCLSVLVRGTNSPAGTKGVSIVDASPLRSALLGSPIFRRMQESSSVSNSPDSLATPGRPGSSPRAWFMKGRLPSTLSDRMRARQIEESPLGRNTRSKHNELPVLKDGWLSGRNLSPTSGIRLNDDDPFGGMYSPWSGLATRPTIGLETLSSQESGPSPPLSSPIAESPVLRSNKLPGVAGVGLGIGLMEPFSLPGDGKSENIARDSDFDTTLKDEAEVESVLDQRMSGPDEDDATFHDTRPPTKRRRTITSRD